MNGTTITVNGITATLTIEEVHATRFGGHVTYARPTYKAMVAHGKYVDNVGNYSNKKQVAELAVAAAEKFLAEVYPAPKPAVVEAAAVVEGEFDWFAALIS